ncbi:hypothetical protein PRIPAC_91401 [Pristionchus pacificus]|uniref:Uncharacterized protein n=1 Tax=Pristionchus pacificus TaxID=54126 RepID=A0A2A6B8H0_PRIPA|nr:hypothetical protein PRIPAC_91401 [Pristionchus pacificus]|eukprot:PDM62176.1 hypothetical protein PRIPAC_51618 [Pristionchus pacificus]
MDSADVDEIQRKAEAKRERREKMKRLCQEMAMRKKIEICLFIFIICFMIFMIIDVRIMIHFECLQKELRQREMKQLEEKKRLYDEERVQVEAAQKAILRQQQLAEELKNLKIGSSQSRLTKGQERLRMRLSARQATKTE